MIVGNSNHREGERWEKPGKKKPAIFFSFVLLGFIFWFFFGGLSFPILLKRFLISSQRFLISSPELGRKILKEKITFRYLIFVGENNSL